MFVLRSTLLAIVVLLQGASCASALADQATVIDNFADASPWSVVASDGVELKCAEQRSPDAGDKHATSLRLDFNFASGSGYAGIRRAVPLDLSKNFELAFSIRGDLPSNNLEFKLVDDTGNNVWWVNRRNFEFPKEWTRLSSRRRHIQFAWGPSSGPLGKIASIEIVISSVEGGRGSIYLDDLTLRTLPEPQEYQGKPNVAASSNAETKSEPRLALDGDDSTAWRSAASDREPTLTIDFGVTREFGGLVVDWDPSAYASAYDIQFSDDGETWTTDTSVRANTGRQQFISLPDSEAKAIRLAMRSPANADQVSIREIEVLPLDATRDPNAFVAEIARRLPRGHYPRPFIGEGMFWTVVGSPGDDHEGLISEDGAVEVDKTAFSLEPFVFVDGKLRGWADAASITQSLADGFAPVPTVKRTYDDLTLEVTAAADGERDSSTVLIRYCVTNTSSKPISGLFDLAIRPLQVNPAYQHINAGGGVSRIDTIAIRDSKRLIDVDDRTIALGEAPASFGCGTFDEGDVSQFLDSGVLPPHSSVTDSRRAASAAVAYRFDLQPGKSQSFVVASPFSRNKVRSAELVQLLLSAADPVDYVIQRERAAVAYWRQATDTYQLLLPDDAADIANTIRSNLAYILINRDGPSIQPGSRSYERSWIRDGSLTTAALLRFGLTQPVREFVDWYAPYQFESGKVPCVVDRRGPEPVPENDSHGQLIMAVMNFYRFTGDREFLERHWPRVQKAVAYIEVLRGQRMTPEYADANTAATHQEFDKPPVGLHAFYGLMPESISHEGYSAKPMHSYWDDFFTLKGLKDAAGMARILGHDDAADRYQHLADDFAKTLYSSLAQTMQAHDIDYIPGCVEMGDFDATSTTIALWPCGELARLPHAALEHTFDRYWDRFVHRRDDPSFAWVDYTPYELRCIGTFVLLDQPQRAQQALEFFMRDRRPPAWNQWPEVVYREPRTAKFLGDLPHTWCGSDFLNSVRMMFLYERDADDAIVLLAGVPASWVSTREIGFRDLPTYGGRISCTLRRDPAKSNRLVANLSGTCPIGHGGVRLTPVLPIKSTATVNGQPASIDADGRIIVRELPADVEWEGPPADAQ